ncbi:MAG TPA: hypothetical protein VFY45_04255 [Baekduia sp.]|nr:hypothetical protein [Baekduia sp.]
MDSPPLDRRQFLALTTLAAGGIMFGGPAGAARAGAYGLASADRTVFVALLALQGAVTGQPWSAPETARHVSDFEAFYASADEGTRAYLRATLQGAAREAALLRVPPRQALDAIRAWDRSALEDDAIGGFPSRRAHLTTLRQALQSLCPIPPGGDAYWLVTE